MRFNHDVGTVPYFYSMANKIALAIHMGAFKTLIITLDFLRQKVGKTLTQKNEVIEHSAFLIKRISTKYVIFDTIPPYKLQYVVLRFNRPSHFRIIASTVGT